MLCDKGSIWKICHQKLVCILDRFIYLLDEINAQDFEPDLLILDNEASQKFYGIFLKHEIKYQLVPSGNHRTDNVKQSIHTFMNHLIAALCLIDLNFPLQLWDKLIQHVNTKLNSLHQSQTHPPL